MQRIACPERDDWQATAESAGFDFHTIDGERYWDERAYYAFALDEIERAIDDEEFTSIEGPGSVLAADLGKLASR